MARVASECCCKLSAISSRQALASLLTRAGRAVSRSNVMEQRLLVVGFVTATGAVMVTAVLWVAVCPASSVPAHVILTSPGDAPAVVSVTVDPVPVTEPVLEMYEYVTGRSSALTTRAEIVDVSPGPTIAGTAEQVMARGASDFAGSGAATTGAAGTS